MLRTQCSLDLPMRCVLGVLLATTACAPASQLHAQSGKQAAKQAVAAAPKQEWVLRSDRYAQILVRAQAAFDPEDFSGYGFTQYDPLAIDLSRDREPRLRAALEAAQRELQQLLQTEKEARVRQDLEVMIASAKRVVRASALQERLMMPWADAPRLLFYGVADLLSSQVPAKRHAAALPRLQRYLGLMKGSTALTQLVRERWEAAASNAALLRPSRLEIERTLETVDAYREGIPALFKEYKIADAEPALAALDQQLSAFASWVRASVLPAARADTILPAELYALQLEDAGVDLDPHLLLRNAQLEFFEVRGAMQLLAERIAREKGLKDSDYRAVIRALKAEPIPAAELERSYREVIEQTGQIIERERIASLPKKPMIIRLATPAENAGVPAPHFWSPPSVNNTGEQGQFILTTGMPSKSPEDKFDDFNYPAVRWTLSAHEGRPGHELQHSAMLEQGVSMARSYFAANSVNAEGWALYAEAELMPYEPLEAQLITLQFRLLRAARAMLDPMLNLGLIEREQAGKLLREEVVMSPGMTKQELDRYTFAAPGQAPSYFYGYSRLEALRSETELLLGPAFDRKAFNDFVLGQGMLPPDLVVKAVKEQFVPARKLLKAP